MSQKRYEIKEKLGEGGAGIVYIAHDNRLDREVALKRINTVESGSSEETLETMLKEARLLSSLNHPNIVTVYDADVDEEGPYVVMELIKGRNVDDIIADNTLTASDFQDFAIQCLEALIAAHSLELLHRDIKPNNIVLKWLPSGQFQAQLLDFGVAKFSKKPSKQTVDQNDSIYGSIYFMAPEQFERTELDVRTDLYALGSVFFYALTGTYPFTGDSPADVMTAHLTHRVIPLSELRPDLPEWLANWVMWLMNRDMKHRPSSGVEALELFMDNLEQVPLKYTAAVRTKFDTSQEGDFFGRAEGRDLFNKDAAKPSKVAQTMAPTIMPGSDVKTTSGSSPAESAPEPIQAEKTEPIPATKPEITARAQAPQSVATTHSESSPETTSLKNTETTHETEIQDNSSETKTHETTQVVEVKSKRGLIVALAVITVALLALIPILLKTLSNTKETESVNKLLAPAKNNNEQIETKKSDVGLLLSQLHVTSGEYDNNLIYKRLADAKSEDYDVDLEIAEFATSKSLLPEVRKALFIVLGKRKGETTLPLIMDFIQTHENSKVVTDAIYSIKFSASDSELDPLLGIINSTEDISLSKAAETVSGEIIKRSKNKSTVTNKILAAHANAMGARLAAGIAAQGGASLPYSCDGNIVFAKLPRAAHVRAKNAGAAYHLWEPTAKLEGDPHEPLLARFVASWSTTAEEVDQLLSILAS